MTKGKHWGANTAYINVTVRADVKEAMEELRVRRCQQAGGYINLGLLFTEAALILLKREGISPDVDEGGNPRKAVVKRGPASTGRKRRETAVA